MSIPVRRICFVDTNVDTSAGALLRNKEEGAFTQLDADSPAGGETGSLEPLS
jgi:hypothetical protein